MKVYMIAGSRSYEGDSLEFSGEVFFKLEDAQKYGHSLVNGRGYDSYVIKEVEVR